MVPIHAKNESGRFMNLVAADVSPLILNWRNLSRLTSAATRLIVFMVPMHARKRKRLSMNQPSPATRAGRSGGPRPVPGRSAWPAPAPRKNHRGPRPCVAAAGGDRPRSDSDRVHGPNACTKRKGALHEPAVARDSSRVKWWTATGPRSQHVACAGTAGKSPTPSSLRGRCGRGPPAVRI